MKNYFLKKTKFAVSGFVLSSAVLSTSMPQVFAATTSPMTKAQFLQMFLQSVNVKPDSRGKSPYADASSKSTSWGYIHKALELNLVTPDSKKKFGVSDPVPASFASQIVAKYFHMNLGKETPSEWAQSQGLTSGLSKQFTSSDGTLFLHRLKNLSISLAAYPNSWTLLPGDVSELSQAFQYLNAAPNGQVSSSMSISMAYNLTSLGKSNKSLLQKIQPYEGSPLSVFQIQANQGVVNNNPAAEVTTAITGRNPAVDNGAPTTETVTDIAYRNNIYENNGTNTSWTPYTDTNAIADSLAFLPVFAPGAFQDITATHLMGSESYSANLTPSTQSEFYSSFLQGMLSTSQGVNPDLITKLAQGLKSTLTIDVVKINGQSTVTDEDLHTTLTVPPSLMSAMSGLPVSPQELSKYMSSAVVTFTSKAQLSYDNVPLTLPNGLSIPGWSSQTSSDSGASNGTSSSSAVSGSAN